MRDRFTFAVAEMLTMELVVDYFKAISKENSFYAVTAQGLVGVGLIPGKGNGPTVISTLPLTKPPV
jgi:hypothetical protein